MAVKEVTKAQRRVLAAPSPVTRSLALLTRDAEERWLLSQPRSVRVSFLHDVIDGPPIPRLDEFWIIRQTNEVRQSYIRNVLNRPGA
jgi:hypothetical protein